jgi:hypothetical protein
MGRDIITPDELGVSGFFANETVHFLYVLTEKIWLLMKKIPRQGISC